MDDSQKAIKHWPQNERPREKLLQRGAQSLSDAELLAIVLRTGTSKHSAVELARSLIKEFGGLGALFNADEKRLLAIYGLGQAKIALLKAVSALGQRQLLESLQDKPNIDSSQAVKDFLRLRYQHQNKEVFVCLFLDHQHAILAVEDLFIGTLNQSHVYPRHILERCLYHNASALIFAHNHPSGVSEPSGADRSITEHLQQAMQAFDIKVLDHLVVGRTITSMAELGWL